MESRSKICPGVSEWERCACVGQPDGLQMLQKSFIHALGKVISALIHLIDGTLNSRYRSFGGETVACPILQMPELEICPVQVCEKVVVVREQRLRSMPPFRERVETLRGFARVVAILEHEKVLHGAVL